MESAMRIIWKNMKMGEWENDEFGKKDVCRYLNSQFGVSNPQAKKLLESPKIIHMQDSFILKLTERIEIWKV